MSVLGRSTQGSLEADSLDLWSLASSVTQVTIEGDELSALCPVTSNPDLYTWKIEHSGTQEIESKSLKMYLLGFRDRGISCADLAATIADDLSRVLNVEVTCALTQQSRGGMRLSAVAVGRMSEREL
ncbi:COG0780 Enzyme related to GTP cyclohydrolase I [uncultured Caudovirales phage]|uniref:COG0780 Enzyme related to GTP cyclohydrolase I n=1 Tax=uncultured Caudovirales phage TaxID=2100421 RepID=A0A6J5RYM1_9CAUD|nr:COG0780 Enzyme related to GTP cyclohydrolase I [uncultured Caudovirales phage]CAB4197244.1 COG0780 Enzyme related to GTP cyclohydrolase I [uncultured Caudovirales phage]